MNIPVEPEGMELRAAIRMNNEKALEYCSECGGSGSRMVNVTGNTKIDFVKCGVCKGKGRKQKLKSTQFEQLTQHWRQEF